MAEIPLNLSERENLRAAFIGAATWHGSLNEAETILASHPELAGSDIHIAAILGDDEKVKRFLAQDPANATAPSAPYGGDALVYLCLSKYLRLDKKRTGSFLKAAAALLEAGADPNTGFWTNGAYPEFETALYGAAGVAHNAELTRLLLNHGANPNDGEAVYHSPETWDNDAMKMLVETGKLTDESLTMMLIRKHDWHDYNGAKYLLEHHANPNGEKIRGWYPIHHALKRDNSIEMLALLLDHGADPGVVNDGLTAIARAAREGRSDVLQLFKERGIPVELQGIDKLIAACAMGDPEAVHAITAQEPHLINEIIATGGRLLANFTGTGNLPGVKQLLDLGVNAGTPYTEGDGYFAIPKGSLAIHIAAWRARPDLVKLLIEHGSPVDMPDSNGQTPLALAVKACVNSYWTDRRSPDSVEALLKAGASATGITFPSGYKEVDELLEKYR
jgi:ankyrin repeat protein